MRVVHIKDVFDERFNERDCEHAEDYALFREIEDWCYDNLPKGRWRLDFAHTVCVCGIDIPGRIFFWVDDDFTAFKLRFGC